MYKIPLLIMAGGLAGVLAGLFGIGGGTVLVPVLIFVLGMTQHQANGTSLVALLLPVGILGVMAYYQSGRIGNFEIKAGILISLGLFVGSYFGSKLAISISDNTLRRLFAVFLLGIAAQMWFRKN